MPNRTRAATPPTDATPDEEPHRLLGFRLPLLTNVWLALATRRFMRLFGLKRLEARVLFVVGINHAVTLKSLGQLAGIEKAYASRTTATMVANGLIAKVVDPGDRRAVRLRLTDAGQAMFDALLAETNARNAAWIGVLDADERRNLHTYLDRLGVRLGEMILEDRGGRKRN